ncbi:MAG TPA: S41 family peptidase [Candidatus Paceibacterota bacterium]
MRKYGVVVGVLVGLCVTGGGLVYGVQAWPASQSAAAASYKTPEEKESEHVRFVMEAYDLIQKNYWQKAPDDQLANHFQLSLEKAAATSSSIKAADRASAAKMLAAAFDALPNDEEKKKVAVGTLQVALYNLAPAGRNQLLSAEEQQAVQETVKNINPASDLYSELGVSASASKSEIQTAYEEKKEKLAIDPDSEEKLARAEYVHNVLTNDSTKARYDESRAEPTVSSEKHGATLYISIGRMSPVTVAEFTEILETASSTPYSSMIIDLRGNIGGALDQIPNFLGLFMGMNQYVFDLYHQDTFEVIRSPVGKLAELDRYKEIAILTDNMSQSSAEVFSAAVKRFGIATVVGTNTRGWGTVEGTYQIETKIDESTTHGLMLVYALTLREDNQPIDGVGVAPDISVSDAHWKNTLPQYFRSPNLIEAVQAFSARSPLH